MIYDFGMAMILAAAAGGATQVEGLPAGVEELLRCREVSEEESRLRCFEERSDALADALERRDVVVADRQEVREAQRELFGFSLPKLRIFDNANSAGDAGENVDFIEGSVASASLNADSRLVVTLQDEQVWLQSDSRPVVRPRPGQPVTIRRASLGSFMMRVNNQPGIRVQRIR